MKNNSSDVSAKSKIESQEKVQSGVRILPRTVWVLGIVSLFMNSASVVITALTPAFIIHVLGATPAAIGYIRGLTESLSYLVKLCSGVFSDYIGKRKIIVLIGYACAAITKPMFALSKTLGLYVTAQVIERIANGLRDTPRDALIADCVPKHLKGESYGVRQSFAYLGSLIGAVACYFVLSHFSPNVDSCCYADSIRYVYFIATVPVFIAVLLLYFGIQEPKGLSGLKERKGFPIKKNDLKQLGNRFWYFMIVCFIFMCARYSESFLVLRAQEMGLDLKFLPLILALMYLLNAPTSKIVGTWSDHMERKIFLAFGFSMMIVACIILAFASEIWHVLLGVAVYGIHYGATQGTFYAMVADYSPSHIKGTSFGVFNLTCAIGMGVSNIMTGELWKAFGAEITLLIISIIAFFATVAIMFVKPNKQCFK